MVARGDKPGPLYVMMLNGFARNAWSIETAMENSESLRSAVERLSRLVLA